MLAAFSYAGLSSGRIIPLIQHWFCCWTIHRSYSPYKFIDPQLALFILCCNNHSLLTLSWLQWKHMNVLQIFFFRVWCRGSYGRSFLTLRIQLILTDCLFWILFIGIIFSVLQWCGIIWYVHSWIDLLKRLQKLVPLWRCCFVYFTILLVWRL